MPLDLKTVTNALLFLGRANLSGNEVPTFVEVSNALHEERIKLEMAQARELLPKDPPAPE